MMKKIHYGSMGRMGRGLAQYSESCNKLSTRAGSTRAGRGERGAPEQGEMFAQMI